MEEQSKMGGRRDYNSHREEDYLLYHKFRSTYYGHSSKPLPALNQQLQFHIPVDAF